MKKLLLYVLVFTCLLSIPAYAQMGSQQGGQMGQGMMGEMPMMNCPMQQMQGQGMMQCGQMAGQGMMGSMMGRFNPWFQHGVSLILRNSGKLGLTDQQKAKIDDVRRKYTKDIIRQEAELKIAEIDLEPLLKESEMNLPKVKEALKKIEDIETQIRYLRVEALTEAKKILTDEQKNSLKKLMELRAAPGTRGMMSLPEAEEEKEETPEEEIPRTDIHGH